MGLRALQLRVHDILDEIEHADNAEASYAKRKKIVSVVITLVGETSVRRAVSEEWGTYLAAQMN